MAGRRPSARPGAVKNRRTRAPVATPKQASRVDRLVDLLDHCAIAKAAADELGESLLAYLLAMAIQEARTALRQPSPRED